MQADALAKILSEQATKDDLRDLETRINAQFVETRAELQQAIVETRADLQQALVETRAELQQSIVESSAVLQQSIARSQIEIMRWGIAMIIAMASIFTLLDIFID